MSTETSHADHERLEDEAAIWAARLRSGGMTDADRAVLQAWLDQDPEHRWMLAQYRGLVSHLDEGLHSPAQVAGIDHTLRRRRQWRVASATLAAAAAIVVLCAVLLGRPKEFSTRTAERHVATLADGSRIELNAQTHLTVDFSRRERRVELTRGEALFTVAQDTERPFFVTTPTGFVRVTGTVFNVRAGGTERVEVTVLEGHVRVRAATATEESDAALTRGRQAIVARDAVQVKTLPELAAQDVIAWRTGMAHFSETPLREVMERFAAYHPRPITIAPEVAELRLGGRYSLDDLNGALETIEQVLPVRVERGGGGAVRIVGAGGR